MNVQVKVFPIPGIADTSRVLDLHVNEGTTIKDLLLLTQETVGKPLPEKGIMLIHNDRVADIMNTDKIMLQAQDWLWIMPVLSGG